MTYSITSFGGTVHRLIFDSTAWLPEPDQLTSDLPLEENVKTVHTAQSRVCWELASRYSSWCKLVHVTALFKFINACRRFTTNCKSTSCALDNHSLSSSECDRAKTYWIKQIQAEVFSEEIKALTSGHTISPKSPLSSFNAFLDSNGVIRVGGRLRHAPPPYDIRHPVLLTPNHIVRLIVSHVRALHGGTQLTLSVLRKEFWILRARSLVRSVIHSCITCVRERAAIPTQQMEDFPAVRVSPPSRSFAHSGVDYAGPIKVCASSGRGIKSHKAYISLFICLATRTIHLELVNDYSISAFMQASKDFVRAEDYLNRFTPTTEPLS